MLAVLWWVGGNKRGSVATTWRRLHGLRGCAGAGHQLKRQQMQPQLVRVAASLELQPGPSARATWLKSHMFDGRIGADVNMLSGRLSMLLPQIEQSRIPEEMLPNRLRRTRGEQFEECDDPEKTPLKGNTSGLPRHNPDEHLSDKSPRKSLRNGKIINRS